MSLIITFFLNNFNFLIFVWVLFFWDKICSRFGNPCIHLASNGKKSRALLPAATTSWLLLVFLINPRADPEDPAYRAAYNKTKATHKQHQHAATCRRACLTPGRLLRAHAKLALCVPFLRSLRVCVRKPTQPVSRSACNKTRSQPADECETIE